MNELVKDLEVRGIEDEDLLEFRIDLLMDLSRDDDAIALYDRLNQDKSDVKTRKKLIQIYDTAGKSSEKVSEYEQLISREPGEVQWYQGLASHYINIAEPDLAVKLWDRFEANNQDRIEVLVQGGEFMNQMGYDSKAVSMVEHYNAINGPSVVGNVFLFETHLARGRTTEAERVLDELKSVLPSDSSDLRTVANSYERLRKYQKAINVYLSIQDPRSNFGLRRLD